jgi:hypothetical protein
MIVSCLAANGAVICSPKKSHCKAHWDICGYIRTPIIIIIITYDTTVQSLNFLYPRPKKGLDPRVQWLDYWTFCRSEWMKCVFLICGESIWDPVLWCALYGAQNNGIPSMHCMSWVTFIACSVFGLYSLAFGGCASIHTYYRIHNNLRSMFP